MAQANFAVIDDDGSPVSTEKLGQVVDALGQFGDQGAALADVRQQRAEAEERAIGKVSELRTIFQPIFDLTQFGPDARALGVVEGVVERIDAVLKDRKIAIEATGGLIEELVTQLTPHRFPEDFLREVLTATIAYKVREYDEMVRLYYEFLATASEVDPDNEPIPRLDGETMHDYLQRAFAD